MGKSLQKWNFGYKFRRSLTKCEIRLQNGKLVLHSTIISYEAYLNSTIFSIFLTIITYLIYYSLFCRIIFVNVIRRGYYGLEFKRILGNYWINWWFLY